MRITTQGQVTIPQSIRERFGLLPGTEVDFVVVDEVVQLRKVEDRPARGRAIVDHLRGRGDARLSTDEIMALTRDAE